MKTSWMALAMLIAALLPSSVGAQLAAGDRIRVHRTSGDPVIGTLVEAEPTGLTIAEGDDEHVIPSERISRVERSLGERRQMGRTIATTAGMGALIMGVVAETSFENCPGGIFPCSKGGAFAYGAVVGGLVMVPVGALLGLATKSDVWEPVALTPPAGFASARFSVAPSGRGVALRLSIPLGGVAR